MPIVALPNGTELEFPDGMTEVAMRDAIFKNFPEYAPKTASGAHASDAEIDQLAAAGTTPESAAGQITAAPTSRESVLEGVQMPEPKFDPAEGLRLSRRSEAEAEELRQANAGRPAARAGSADAVRPSGDGMMGRAGDLIAGQTYKAASGFGRMLATGAETVGAEDLAADINARAAAASDKSRRLEQGVELERAGRVGDQVEGFAPGSIAHDSRQFADEYLPQILAQSPQLPMAMFGGLAPLVGISYLSSYADARDAGRSPTEALAYAVPQASAEYIGERLGGMGKLSQAFEAAMASGFARDAAWRNLGKAFMAAGAKEVPSEELTYGLQFVNDKFSPVGLQPGATWEDFKKGAADTAIVAMGSGGMLAGAGALVTGRNPAPEPPADPIAPILQAETADQAIAAAAQALDTPPAQPPAPQSVQAVANIERILGDANVSTPPAVQGVDPGAAGSRVDLAAPGLGDGVGTDGTPVPAVDAGGTAAAPAAADLPQPAGPDLDALRGENAAFRNQALQALQTQQVPALQAEAPPVVGSDTPAAAQLPPAGPAALEAGGVAAPPPGTAEAAPALGLPASMPAETKVSAPPAAPEPALSARQIAIESERARIEEKRAQRRAAAQEAAKPMEGLSVGTMPTNAEPVSVKDGVVYIGKYPAQNYDTGADVTVPAGATPAQIAAALKESGALGKRSKVFGLPATELPPAETPGMPSAAQQRADFAAAEKARTAPGNRARGRAQDANTFKAFMAKHGISNALANEFAPGKKERQAAMVQGYGPVFRKSGLQLDALAELAVQDGYLTTPDVTRLASMISDALRGKRIVPQYAEGVAETEMERRAALEKEAGEEQNAEVEAETRAEREAIQALTALSDDSLQALAADDVVLTAGNNVSEADFLRALGATEQEIRDATQGQGRKGQDTEGRPGPQEAAAGATPGSAEGRDGQARADGEGLSAPTFSVKLEAGQNTLHRNPQFHEAEAQAKTLPKGQHTRITIDRTAPNGTQEPTRHGAWASNGDGTATFVEKVFPASREPLTDADIAALHETATKNEQGRQEKIAAANQTRIDQIESKKLRLGTEWSGAQTYVHGKTGITTFSNSKITGIGPDGFLTVESTLRGSNRTYKFTVDANSRLFDNYPTPDGLTAPTREEVTAQQDRAAQADELDQREQVRRESEAGAGLFSLTQEDGRQDTTGDLFGQPAEPTPPKTIADMSPADLLRAAADKLEGKQQPEKIDDLGEKIGGARKDTAMSGGKRGSRKTEDDRPAWARRFEISQIVRAGGQIGEVRNEGRWVIRDTRSLDWRKMPKQVGRDTYASREEAEKAVPLLAVSMKHRVVPATGPNSTQAWEIWRDISDRKRVKVVDLQFSSRDDAMRYMAENAEAIIEANTTFGEADLPVPEDKRREGPQRRQGDVKGEDFMQAFGFRAIEFGNWNNQAERQELMNEAYDGLMDLADVMGIPPKAISLNGDLALAFGARGHGLSGARAHYEPDRAVMNLTKMKGAGALAHEWFHALDHYFGRQDGKAPVQWVTNTDGTRSLKTNADFEDNAVTSGFSRKDSGVRQEVREAYVALMDTMMRRAEKYVEDTAKTERFVAQVRHNVEEQLTKIRKDLAEQKDPRYWKRNNKPATADQLAEFDAIAQQILEGTALETELRPSGTKSMTGMRWSNDHLENLSTIYKAVRGRSGFDADKNGALDRLRQVMGLYSGRLKMLAEAQAGEEKTKKVPTDFAMDAKSLDQGRGTDYWITPHEMAARAFQGYVEDKIAERGGKSPFLNYGPENAGILTPWGAKRPYPAGEERKAINAAFDKLVGVIQTKETDKGVAMFSRDEAERPYIINPTTVANVQTAITELLGGKQLAGGLGRIVATTSAEIKSKWEPLIGKNVQIGSEGEAGVAQAFFEPGTKTVFMIADHITIGTETAVLGHELMHKHGQAVLGEAGWNRLHGMIGTWKNAAEDSDERFVYDYASRKVQAVGEELSTQELFPYAVEAAIRIGVKPSMAAKRGTVASWLESVRQNLKQVWGRITGKPETFKAQDLVDLAFGIAQMENPETAALRGALAEQTGTPESTSTSFSREAEDPEGKALRALSENDELFALPKSDKTTVDGIAADNNPRIQVRQTKIGNETLYVLTMPNSGTAKLWVRPANPYGDQIYSMDLVDGDTSNVETGRPGENPEDVDPSVDDVYLDVSNLKPGQDGNVAYNIAATFAHNTGRIFIGDPSGLSDIAMRRRLENMISTALKFGTTDHIAPHPRQVKGGAGVPPLKWVYGDSLGNIRRMIDASLKAGENSGKPQLAYDTRTGNFSEEPARSTVDAAGGRLEQVSGPATGGLPRVQSATESSRRTEKRAAIFRALLRETSEGRVGAQRGRDGILAGLSRVRDQFPGATEGIFYSRAGVGVPGRAAAIPKKNSPWRDTTGRLQFAPGQWLYDKFGPEIGGAVIGGSVGSAAGPIGTVAGAAAGAVSARFMLNKLQLKAASPELRRMLRDMKVQVERAQETAAAVAGEAFKLTDAERAMVSDLVEKEVQAGVQPPAHAVQLAAMINDAMGRQTDELIRLGMLTTETAEKWRGQYLPRYYESKLGKKLQDAWADSIGKMFATPRTAQGIRGKHLRGRGMYQTIPESQLADYEALGWEVRDPDYQPGLVDGTVQVWRDFTRQERDKMGEIRDAGFRFVMGYMETQKDIALGRLYEALASNPDMSSRTETEKFSAQVPDTKVPGTGAKTYGKMAGRWVSPETLSQLSRAGEEGNEALMMYRKAMSYWKQGKTSLNPVSHANNVISNISMAHFAGVSYWRPDLYSDAIRDLVTKAPMVKEAKEAGLFLGSMSEAELMNTMPAELRALAGKQDGAAAKAGKTVWDMMTFWLSTPMGKAYQAEDSFFRYLIYRDARTRGLEPADAVDYAQKYIFTYDDLPKGARMIRDFGMPFFAYTYKAVPALLHTALTHPDRMLAPAAVLWTINAAAYAIAAGDDDESWDTKLRRYLNDPEFRAKVREAESLERRYLPEWMKGTTALMTPKTIRLGMDEVTNLPLFLDMSRMMPGGDLFDVNPNAGGIPLPQPITPNHPLFTLSVGLLANKDLFRGNDLTDNNDTSDEKLAKRSDWLWKQLSPAIAVNNYHWERWMNAIAQTNGGEVKYVPDALGGNATGIGRDSLPVQPKLAALQTVGIKLRPIDLDTSEQIDRSMRDKMVSDIDAEIRKLRRLNNIGAISDRVFESEKDKADEKKMRVSEGLTVDGDERK